jgi:hypothetical protein
LKQIVEGIEHRARLANGINGKGQRAQSASKQMSNFSLIHSSNSGYSSGSFSLNNYYYSNSCAINGADLLSFYKLPFNSNNYEFDDSYLSSNSSHYSSLFKR